MHFILVKYCKLATILSKGGNRPPVLGCLMSSLCHFGWCDTNRTNPICVPLPAKASKATVAVAISKARTSLPIITNLSWSFVL